MAFKLLPDNFRCNVTAAGYTTGADEPRHSFYDSLRKGRGRRWRSAYAPAMVVYHQVAVAQAVDHVVITEAHKCNPLTVLYTGYNATGSGTYSPLAYWNQTIVENLIGPHGQDLAASFNSVSALRVAIGGDQIFS